jgi:predicted DNA binding protein
MNELELGTCIKNLNREVLSQNDLCLKTCGEMVGTVCSKGCMSSYSQISGMTLIKNSIVDNNTVDAVVINDGKTLTTLIYLSAKSEEEIEAEIIVEKNRLTAFGLSKSEITVFVLVLQGRKNSQIIKELFISKATLKTHLNNAYKKLPEYYQQYKNRR